MAMEMVGHKPSYAKAKERKSLKSQPMHYTEYMLLSFNTSVTHSYYAHKINVAPAIKRYNRCKIMYDFTT